MNPYLVLGITPDAGDQAIRRAYLEAVKEASPDTDPVRFRAVSEAYEKIKDERSRNLYALFNRDLPGDSPLDTFVQFHRLKGSPRPAPMNVMKDFMRKCSKT